MKSSRARIYSLLILLILTIVFACHTKYWQEVTVPTLRLYSKTSTTNGQKLNFIVSNPTDTKGTFGVVCTDTETEEDRVASTNIEVSPHSDKMITILYPQLMFSRNITCELQQEK